MLTKESQAATDTETVTLDAEAGEESQSGEGQNETAESKDAKEPKAKGAAQPAKSGSATPTQKAETLRTLLKREKDDPNVKFTDAELDILDEHYAGKIQPAKAPKKSKPVAPKAEGEEGGEGEAEGSEAEEKPAEESEEGEAKDEADDEEGDNEPEPDADAKALMKEVGAKSLKDALAKVKQLRALTGTRTAQTVAKLERQIQSEKSLMEDVAKGVPGAIEHFQRAYPNIKLATKQETDNGSRNGRRDGTGDRQQRAQGRGQRSYIPEEAFIDPESAKLANEALRARDLELDELKSRIKDFDDERERNRKETALTQAQNHVIDEMVQVAQGIPTLKAVGNLREAIAAWYQGKPDSRMESFNELFDIAQSEGCSLKAAALIKRGRDSERLIAEAEANGRKSAYGHKPNPSLSGQQGGKGEKTTYQNLTDEQVDAMAENHALMPQDWFDDKDNPVQSKIPKRAWRIFGFKG